TSSGRTSRTTGSMWQDHCSARCWPLGRRSCSGGPEVAEPDPVLPRGTFKRRSRSPTSNEAWSWQLDARAHLAPSELKYGCTGKTTGDDTTDERRHGQPDERLSDPGRSRSGHGPGGPPHPSGPHRPREGGSDEGSSFEPRGLGSTDGP